MLSTSSHQHKLYTIVSNSKILNKFNMQHVATIKAGVFKGERA